MHCARTHVRLDEVLDSIRDNLRREQKTVMELNCAQPCFPFSATRRVECRAYGDVQRRAGHLRIRGCKADWRLRMVPRKSALDGYVPICC